MVASLPEPVIVVERGLGSPIMQPLSGEKTLIGSHPAADVCLPNPYVSRRHALITRSDVGRFSIRDLESKNGTTLNGLELSSAAVEIKTGDEIVLGGGAVQFTVHLQGGTLDKLATFRPTNANLIDFDCAKRTLVVDGTAFQLPLSQRQCDLLDALFRNPGRIVSFDDLKKVGWPDKNGSEVSMSTLRTHMSVVRSCLGPIGNGCLRILTLRERGYVLEL